MHAWIVHKPLKLELRNFSFSRGVVAVGGGGDRGLVERGYDWAVTDTRAGDLLLCSNPIASIEP